MYLYLKKIVYRVMEKWAKIDPNRGINQTNEGKISISGY